MGGPRPTGRAGSGGAGRTGELSTSALCLVLAEPARPTGTLQPPRRAAAWQDDSYEGTADGTGRGGGPVTPDQAKAAAAIEEALAALGLVAESPEPGSFLVRLEGQRKLVTMTWLIAGTHSLHVEAFFCRRPDENQERFYRFLLERNGRMYGVHFAVDPQGDVYLTGRQPLQSVSTEEIDRLLGCVLSYSDDNFNAALAIGFESSIRREWAWRIKRGESTANLRAFARFAGPDAPP